MLGASCRVVNPLPMPCLTDRRSRSVRDALTVTLSSLSPTRRQVLLLTALGGLAPADIAPLLGMSIEAVAGVLESATNDVVGRLVA